MNDGRKNRRKKEINKKYNTFEELYKNYKDINF